MSKVKPGQTAEATEFAIAVTAGEALSANDACYISAADGKAYKTDADDLTKIGFEGFAVAAAALNATVYLKPPPSLMDGFVGLTVGADYYLSGTAGAITATKPANFKLVGRAVTTTTIRMTTEPTKRVRVYTTTPTVIGGSTTRFDITVPVAGTARYTFDGTGTDPALSLANNPIGSLIVFRAQNFNAANNGTFVVTGAGSNYVEVANASAVAENDKTIGNGYVARGTTSEVWVKPGGLIRAEIEVIAGGGAGGNSSSGGTTETAGAAGGGGGGYSKESLLAGDLAASVGVEVCPAGTSALDVSARRSSFGPYLYATGGANGGGEGGTGGAGGVGADGDENIAGQGGGPGSMANTTSPRQTDQAGNGGSSHKGGGAPASGGGTVTGANGGQYGGGGAGGAISGANQTGNGGSGAQGAVIVTEFY